jgi:hypothetical protein
MTRYVTSKIVKVDEKFVTIEIEETRPDVEPFRRSLDIEHDGNPEKAHRFLHDSIAAGRPVFTAITDPVVLAKLQAINPRHSKARNDLETMSVGEMKCVANKTEAQLKALVRRMNPEHQKSGKPGRWTVLLASDIGHQLKAVRRDS